MLLLVAKSVAFAFGLSLLFLIWWLPEHIEHMRNHGGGVFGPGLPSLVEALKSLITASSIFAAIAALFVILPFQGTGYPLAVLLGLLTFVVFLSGILTIVYFLLIRPLSGTAPTLQNVYLSLRLILLGLALTVFTIALII